MHLHLATTNPGKLRDFSHALTPALAARYTLSPLPGLAHIPAPEETADTFAGNARLKALFYSRHAPGLHVLADDSGLEVDALDGAPGARSARFADDLAFAVHTGETHDQHNNACLQIQMLQHPFERQARFRCVLALAQDGEMLASAAGTVEGEILASPRGTHGFGYDPLFLLPALNQTMAELDPETRQLHSHRARALTQLLTRLG